MPDHRKVPDLQPEQADPGATGNSGEEAQGRREFLGKGIAVAAGATVAAAALSPLLADDTAQAADCRTLTVSYTFRTGEGVRPEQIMRSISGSNSRVEGFLQRAIGECESPCWHMHVPQPENEILGARVGVGSA